MEIFNRLCDMLRFKQLSIDLCDACNGHALCNIYGIEQLLSFKFASWIWASCCLLAECNNLVISSWFISITVHLKAFLSEFGYPAFESFHEIKVVQGTLRRKSVACGQSLSEHSHKLKKKEWSEWMVCCSISAALPVVWNDINLAIQPLSAACFRSIVVVIFISLPRIFLGFVF